MDLKSIVLSPVRLPFRLVRAVEELASEVAQARSLVTGTNVTLQAALQAITLLTRTAESLDVTAQQIVVGGKDLTEATRGQERRTEELISGGEDLTAVAEQLALDLAVLRDALPRILEALDTVDRLEGEVETVAETIEPLQGAAERVGRVTRRLSRTP